MIRYLDFMVVADSDEVSPGWTEGQLVDWQCMTSHVSNLQKMGDLQQMNM